MHVWVLLYRTAWQGSCCCAHCGWCVQDFYDVLGVEYDASEDSIRTNYLRLALVRTFWLSLLLLIFLSKQYKSYLG